MILDERPSVHGAGPEWWARTARIGGMTCRCGQCGRLTVSKRTGRPMMHRSADHSICGGTYAPGRGVAIMLVGDRWVTS